MPSSDIPRLSSRHLLGHLRAMRDDPLALQLCAATTGPLVRARMGTVDFIWASSPAALSEVLVERNEDFEKPDLFRRALCPIVGDGILTSHGTRHRRRRQLMAPALQASRVASYADAMVAVTERVIDDALRSPRFDVGDAMLRLTLDVVCTTLIHSSVSGDAREVGDAVARGSEAAIRIVHSPLLALVPPTRFTPHGRALFDARTRLDRVLDRIITERRASRNDPGDVLSLLIAARDAQTGEPLDDLELRDEIMTLFLAGHETTANALTWALQLIANTPHVAERLAREVDEALGTRLPAAADLGRLPYAAAVFKEAMRLYPPAYVVNRQALTRTRVLGHTLERGELVFCNIYGVHHDEQHFPRAHEFLPERFLDGAEKTWPRGAYLPFSLGPRICVGNHFALMEGQLVLARFAQRLALSGAIVGIAAAEPLITLRPRGPVTMTAQPRRPALHEASA
jgi:cytochrome P450